MMRGQTGIVQNSTPFSIFHFILCIVSDGVTRSRKKSQQGAGSPERLKVSDMERDVDK